uniref:Fe2OG dioxygenase domain-containing protein n=1 Tax=viral metagenome TaxID=1070528 RepID=A0A6C0B6W7_9ZZZZ
MSTFDKNLIYTYDHAISPSLCKTIIDMYEKEDDKYNGVTGRGYDPTIKETVDFNIPNGVSPWERIYTFLNKELTKNIKLYFNQLNTINNLDILSSKYIGGKFLQYDSFMIQKYFKNKGKFEYHNDFSCDFEKSRYRLVTFIFYLNDVDEGGETEIWGHMRIKPTAGKLLLFPALWTFPHCGKIPTSSDKYIITGWLYINQNHNVITRLNKLIDNYKPRVI